MTRTLKASRPGSPHLVQIIGDAIREGRLVKGDRLQPVRQLAMEYGLSFETVRSALGILEQEGLIVCRRGSGSFVTYERETSETLERHTDDVALWLKFGGHVFQNMADELLMLLQERQRYSINTATWRDTAGLEQLQGLTARWGTGSPRYLVVQWEKPGLDESISAWLSASRYRTRVIAVFRDPRLLPAGWHSVNPDHNSMVRLAMEHLLNQGHRSFGFVTYARMVRPEWKHTLRKATEPHTLTIEAMGRVLREHAIRGALQVRYLKREADPHRSDLFNDPPADPSTESNQALITDWLSKPNRPTAIIGEDFRVMGVKVAAERLGLRIPQDLALVGLGNTPWSVAGQFPSVAYGEEMAARQVVRLIQAEDEEVEGATTHLTVPPRLVIR